MSLKIGNKSKLEYKVPKREPSKTKHKGNDGMNAWWMGLEKGAKQKLFPLLIYIRE
jgi:hypothetical protein